LQIELDYAWPYRSKARIIAAISAGCRLLRPCWRHGFILLMEDDQSNVSLVVGGTGMLAAATHWLAQHSRTTLIVARHATSFSAGDSGFIPLDADWNSAHFCHILGSAIRAAQPVDRALLWLHEPAPVLPWLLPLLGQARTVLVLGSTDGLPKVFGSSTDVTTVRLGSMVVNNARRWLTHEEISAGAIEALRDGQSRIIGELAGLR
jgi:hypothetical protein